MDSNKSKTWKFSINEFENGNGIQNNGYCGESSATKLTKSVKRKLKVFFLVFLFSQQCKRLLFPPSRFHDLVANYFASITGTRSVLGFSFFCFFFLSFLILGWFHAFASTDYLWHFYCIESFKRVRATFHTFIMTSIHNNCQFHAAYNITTAFSKSWIRCRTIRYVDWLNERCVCVLFHNFVLFLIYLVLQSFFQLISILPEFPWITEGNLMIITEETLFFSRSKQFSLQLEHHLDRFLTWNGKNRRFLSIKNQCF